MDRAPNDLEIRIERKIASSPEAAYAAWLDASVPGTPWNFAGKLVMDCKEDGLFYARMGETPHYGRFTRLEPGRAVQHTWISPPTMGYETLVSVTFAADGKDTLMTLVHSGLPNNSSGLGHEKGWNMIMQSFLKTAA
jgi:uncharacterized protein YndB with AHSA1/START domain